MAAVIRGSTEQQTFPLTTHPTHHYNVCWLLGVHSLTRMRYVVENSSDRPLV